MVVKDNNKDNNKKGGEDEMRRYNLMNIKLSRFD